MQHEMLPVWLSLAFHVVAMPLSASTVSDLNNLRVYLLELQELTYACQKAKRIGNTHDGGYVVCLDAKLGGGNGCTLLSYGIGDDDSFESQMSLELGCLVHEFDPTVGKSEGSTRFPSQIHFHKEGLGAENGVASVGRVNTLPNHMSQFVPDLGRVPLFVKMDIEDAEWDSMSVIPDTVFKQVDFLIIELHMHQGVQDIARRAIARGEKIHWPDSWNLPQAKEKLLQTLPSRITVLQRLKQHFHLYNVNFNNCDACRRPFPEAPGYFIPTAVDLSLIRKDLTNSVEIGSFVDHGALNAKASPTRPSLDFASFPVPLALDDDNADRKPQAEDL